MKALLERDRHAVQRAERFAAVRMALVGRLRFLQSFVKPRHDDGIERRIDCFDPRDEGPCRLRPPKSRAARSAGQSRSPTNESGCWSRIAVANHGPVALLTNYCSTSSSSGSFAFSLSTPSPDTPGKIRHDQVLEILQTVQVLQSRIGHLRAADVQDIPGSSAAQGASVLIGDVALVEIQPLELRHALQVRQPRVVDLA